MCLIEQSSHEPEQGPLPYEGEERSIPLDS